MKDTFSSYHPITCLLYFVIIIGLGMFMMHPVFLVISLVGGLCYEAYLQGMKVMIRELMYCSLLCLVVGVINPLFNHQGVTIITYLGDNPLTLESICYGGAMAVLLLEVLGWFKCYRQVMTGDKLIYLIGRKMPTLALIFSMTLRMIPLFKRQYEKVKRAQEGIGNMPENKNPLKKLKWGMKTLSIMITWILENAIDTADSMKSRGYGLEGRTYFSIYRFEKRDALVLGVMVILFGVILIGGIHQAFYIRYFPSIKMQPMTLLGGMIYLAYGVLCMLPLILHGVEDLKWHYLK